MVEVAYQIRGGADYTVASEEEEPGNGWPYDRILAKLTAQPDMSPDQLAKTVVAEYLASYGKNERVTQSAMRLADLEPLATAVSGLGAALRTALRDPRAYAAILAARNMVQEYSRPYDEYCDLIDLCDLLKRSLGGNVGQACDVVKKAAKKAVRASGSKGNAVAHSNGVSIYFPKRNLSPLYKRLDFGKKGAWKGFLEAYLGKRGR